MRGVYVHIKGFPDTVKHSFEDIEVPMIKKKPKRIVVVGMGANYDAGLLLKEMLRDEIRVEVYQRSFIRQSDELVIFLSYSGNTREVVNVFDKTLGRNFLVVTSGGKLLDSAKKRRCPVVELPDHMHSRFTFSECFFPVLKCLGDSGIIKKKDRVVKKIYKTLNYEEKRVEMEAKKLAGYIEKRMPLFYATEYFWPLAHRFKSTIAEDDKVICHANKITELFHNEIEALPSYDTDKFFPILFVDKKESWEYTQMLEFFKKKLKRFFYFGYENYSKEERMFLGFLLCYYLGFYLAIKKQR